MFLYNIELSRCWWKIGAFTFFSCYLSRFKSATS